MVLKLYSECEDWLGWIENCRGELIGFVKRTGEFIWDW